MTSMAWWPPAARPSTEADQLLGVSVAGKAQTTLLHIDREHRPAKRQQRLGLGDAAAISPKTEQTTALLGLHQGTPLCADAHHTGEGETGSRIKHLIPLHSEGLEGISPTPRGRLLHLLHRWQRDQSKVRTRWWRDGFRFRAQGLRRNGADRRRLGRSAGHQRQAPQEPSGDANGSISRRFPPDP